MRFVVLDIESYFSQDYTLSKLSTEAYIRDPQFHAHGAAIKWGPDQPAKWYDERFLRQVLKDEDWGDVFLIHHHAQFDGFILTHHYDVHPMRYGCTLSMARLLLGNHLSVSLDSVRSHFGLPAKRTPYNLFKGKQWSELDQETQALIAEGACDEVESIWAIFQKMMRGEGCDPFPREELELIDLTVRMFVEPVLQADTDMLGKLWLAEENGKAEKLAALGVTEADLQSADRFQKLLEAEGVEVGCKNGKNGEIPAFAKTDDFMRDLLEHDSERVRLLAATRLGVKSTLTQRYCETMGWTASRGALPMYYRYAGAHTSRWSGGGGGSQSLNPQNLKRGSDLRKAILAPEGYLLGVIDLAQIECVAEGQLVLTEQGSKAIQSVELTDRIWDGSAFVSHGGVVFKGIQEVISYQGLTATPEHVVYPRSGSFEKDGIPLCIAAALGVDISSSDASFAICQTSLRQPFMSWVQNLWQARYKISFSERQRRCFVGAGESSAPHLRRCGDRSNRQRWSLRTWQSAIVHTAEKCQQSLHDFLGSYSKRAFVPGGFHESLSRERLRERSDSFSCPSGVNWGANNRAVQTRSVEKEKMRVYDILNAGPRHRFMVSGVVVSNCRVLNYLAGQNDVVEKFKIGEDPYVGIASAFYKRPITKADVHERGTGKQAELSCGYGCGAKKFQATAKLGIYGPPVVLSDDEAKQFVTLYRSTHASVVAYWRFAEQIITRLATSDYPIRWGPMRVENGKIYLPNGIPLDYSTLNFHEDRDNGERYWRVRRRYGWAKVWGGIIVENVVQALARVVLSQAMLRIRQQGYRILMTSHDEIVVPLKNDGYATQHLDRLKDEMRQEPAWMPGIPLDAEATIGRRYSK